MTSEFSKIEYVDLRWEFLHKRLNEIVGRSEEKNRLSRITHRQLLNNCMVVGQSGIGKTSLILGWAASNISANPSQPIVQLDTESFHQLMGATGNVFPRFEEAFASLPDSIIVLDNFGQLVFNKPQILHSVMRLLKPLLESPRYPVVCVLQPQEFKWLSESEPTFPQHFEMLAINELSEANQTLVLKNKMSVFQKKHPVSASLEVLGSIVKFAKRYKKLGTCPRSCVQILDEAVASTRVLGSLEITQEMVETIVSEKVGVPLHQLQANDLVLLKNLEMDLLRKVKGQETAINKINRHIQRAKLGLKNPNRPLASFLVLGSSGVGKTETAKVLADRLFGKKESFVRIDMSEFGESHTVQRLLGAPAGYSGYDAGGGLTNPVKAEPYSLILLDEIEKAHAKIFDIFLQVLDDGRLTSGQGETVDFTNTIIMATSNLGVEEIIAGFANREDIHGEEFFQEKLIPILSKHFRLEFLNRFDAVIVFKPLETADLVQIALLEIANIEQRVQKHKIKFNIDPVVLSKKIATLVDFRFGARPIKRYVEEVCETLITQSLLDK